MRDSEVLVAWTPERLGCSPAEAIDTTMPGGKFVFYNSGRPDPKRKQTKSEHFV